MHMSPVLFYISRNYIINYHGILKSALHSIIIIFYTRLSFTLAKKVTVVIPTFRKHTQLPSSGNDVERSTLVHLKGDRW